MILTTVKFFGQYLLEKGRITNDQLLAAVEYQNARNPRLGTLAVDRGFLSAEHARSINEAQKSKDRLFGDLAVEMGYLTSEQLSELVDIQKRSRLFLGEALVEKGILTHDELEQELAQFRAEQQASQMMIRGALVQFKGAEFIVDVLDVVLKLFKRIVHEHVLIEDCHPDRDRWPKHDLTATQEFTGDISATFALGLPEAFALKIAGKMLEEEFTQLDELSRDATQEFVNIVCGNVCAKLSGRDLNVGLKAPKLFEHQGAEPLPQGYTVVVSLAGVDAKLDIAIVQHDA